MDGPRCSLPKSSVRRWRATLFDGHGDCRREEWSRSDEEKVWLLEAGYRAVWGLARDNAKEIAEHCGRGFVAAITQPGRDFFRERERAVALTGDASALDGVRLRSRDDQKRGLRAAHTGKE